MITANQFLPLSSPHFSGKELDYIRQAISQGNIATNGSFIREFEQQLETQFKTPYVIALNSGTSAMHLALHLLGVGMGDEVICQSFTFVASANPIRYLGGIPVFVDSEEQTWNICPDKLEETILARLSKGKKPKAIVAVNLFGMPADWPRIRQIGEKYNIPLLEDAAESVGSKIGDQFTGTFGDIGVFSFNGNKIITTGGGGALVTRNRFWEKKSRYLSTQAKLNFPHYEHSELGYNCKMNNLAAGIGLAQIEELQERIQDRRKVFAYYKRILNTLPGIQFLEEPDGYFSNRWLSTLLVDPKEVGFEVAELRESLLQVGIESRFLWKPMHLQPLYKDAVFLGGHVAEDLFQRGICLPSGWHTKESDLDRVMEIITRMHSSETVVNTRNTV